MYGIIESGLLLNVGKMNGGGQLDIVGATMFNLLKIKCRNASKSKSKNQQFSKTETKPFDGTTYAFHYDPSKEKKSPE